MHQGDSGGLEFFFESLDGPGGGEVRVADPDRAAMPFCVIDQFAELGPDAGLFQDIVQKDVSTSRGDV